MRYSTLMLAVAGTLALAGQPLAAQAHKAAHWTYEGAEGPAHWGEIDPTYAACKSGKEQSPVDLGATIAATRGAMDERFYASTFVFFHNGHTVQAQLDRGSTLNFEGTPFQALQFHFHHPSEHTVQGKQFPAELHLVHRNTKGELAVLGIFINYSTQDNPAFEPLMARLPIMAGDSVKFSTPVDIGALLGAKEANENFYLYRGSLTTPPCTEGVQWIVRERPMFASRRQLQRLVKVLGESARPVQPANDRH
jgi:carbonic anhydrase